MLDVSESGAQIKLSEPIELPDEFTLILTRGGEVQRQCQKVWQDRDQLGIRFIKRAVAR